MEQIVGIFVAALRQAIQQELTVLTERVAKLEETQGTDDKHIIRVITSELGREGSTLNEMLHQPLEVHENNYSHDDFITEVDEDFVRDSVRSILKDATISL